MRDRIRDKLQPSSYLITATLLRSKVSVTLTMIMNPRIPRWKYWSMPNTVIPFFSTLTVRAPNSVLMGSPIPPLPKTSFEQIFGLSTDY
jgi:hypothetical protein